MEKYIPENFIKRTEKSRKLHEDAIGIMPMGGAGDSMAGWDPYPPCINRAEGSRVYDIDGNEYIDFLMGFGPLILGHAHPSIVEAVEKQMKKFIPNAVMHEDLYLFASKIKQHMPSMELIRFLPSGTEAISAAIKVARAYTKRTKLAKIEGAYHGQSAEVTISIEPKKEKRGSEKEPAKVPYSAGIPTAYLEMMTILPFNNIDYSVSLIEKYAEDLAVVLVEPVIGFGGGLPASVDYIKALREVTEKNDILLLFDEIVTGFRLGLGGVQEYYGVTPDLTVIGKAVGGGFPIGIYGGRKEVMDVVVKSVKRPMEKGVFQSGTFSGHAFSIAAGLAVMNELEKGYVYDHINNLGETLRDGLRQLFKEEQVNAQVTGIGSIIGTHFTDKPIKSVRDITDADGEKLKEFHLRSVDKGIYIFPGHVEVVCLAHTKDDIDKKLEISRDVVKDMKRRHRSI